MPRGSRAQQAAGRAGRPLRRHPARLDRLPADASPDRRHPAPLRGARARRARSSILALGRDGNALEPLVTRWYTATSGVDGATATSARRRRRRRASIRCCVLALRPFLARCAEALMQRVDLSALAPRPLPVLRLGARFAVITPSGGPAADLRPLRRRSGRSTPLTCPFCANDDRALHHLVRHARRPLPRLRLRRLPALSEGVRRAERDAAGAWWRSTRSPRCRSTRPRCSAATCKNRGSWLRARGSCDHETQNSFSSFVLGRRARCSTSTRHES